MAIIHTPHTDTLAPSPAELHRILRREVSVVVQVAERKLLIAQILNLGVGTIIEFAKSSDQPLKLLVGNQPIAGGQAVKVGENFGLRISEVGDVEQIIQSMSGKAC